MPSFAARAFALLAVAACVVGCGSPQFTLAFSLPPAIVAPCSQVPVQLFPGPHDGHDLAIRVTLPAPPAGISAPPISTRTTADSATLVIDIANVRGRYSLDIVAEANGARAVHV